MRSPLTTLPALALALALSPSAGAEPAGYIANPITDRLVVEPLKKADSVWDVFQVISSWLSEVYPQKGQAREAITAIDAMIKKFNDGKPRDPQSAPRTAEMPIGVDQLLRVLRREAPTGGTRGFPGELAGNVKAQIYTAALLPFLQCRGIAYRMRPLVEQSYILHSTALNNLRHMKQTMRVRSGNNGLAVFEFLTYPLANDKRQNVQFLKVSDLQSWLIESMIPTLDVAIAIGENALKQMSPDHRESLDLTVFLQAEDPFPHETMEMGHRYFGRAEVEQLLARAYRYRAAMRLFCAYDLDDVPGVTNKMRDVLTRNFFKEKVSFGRTPRVGSPPMVRYQILESFPKLGTLRDGALGPKALDDLRMAWKHFSSGMDSYYAARPSGKEDRLVRLEWIHATFREFKTKISPQVSAALAGPASLTDYVGGRTVDLDLPGFLSSLPKDLKAFLPEKFVDKDPYWVYNFSTGDMSYTNYDFGTPVSWKSGSKGDAWAKLFPNIAGEANAQGQWDAPLAIYRDITRTYVGGLIGPALSSVLF